ncbi:MAG: hypothetical protein ACFB21_11010, partial [Opitutales bacterium]
MNARLPFLLYPASSAIFIVLLGGAFATAAEPAGLAEALGDPPMAFEVEAENWAVDATAGSGGGPGLATEPTNSSGGDLAGWLEAPAVIRFRYRAEGDAHALRFFNGADWVDLEAVSEWQTHAEQVVVPNPLGLADPDGEVVPPEPTPELVLWSPSDYWWSDGESGRIILDDVKVFPGYAIEPVVGIGGRIEREPDLPAYAFGTVVTLTAIPDEGFAFKQWGEFQHNSFAPQHPEPVLEVIAGVSHLPAAWFTAGTTFSNDGLSFTTVDGFGHSEPGNANSRAEAAFIRTAPGEWEARTSPNRDAGLRASFTGPGELSFAWESLHGDEDTARFWFGTSVSILRSGERQEIEFGSGEHQVRWTYDAAQGQPGYARISELRYLPGYRLALDPQPGGMVEPGGDLSFPPGNIAEVTAVPRHGNRFVGWEIDGTTELTENPLSLEMNAPREGWALFAAPTVLDGFPVSQSADPYWVLAPPFDDPSAAPVLTTAAGRSARTLTIEVPSSGDLTFEARVTGEDPDWSPDTLRVNANGAGNTVVFQPQPDEAVWETRSLRMPTAGGFFNFCPGDRRNEVRNLRFQPNARLSATALGGGSIT